MQHVCHVHKQAELSVQCSTVYVEYALVLCCGLSEPVGTGNLVGPILCVAVSQRGLVRPTLVVHFTQHVACKDIKVPYLPVPEPTAMAC